MKCTQCGAQLEPTVVTCSYCGAATPFGIQQQHAHHHHAAQAHAFKLHRDHEEAQRKQQDAQRSLKRTADASMFWGIGGLVLCCFFVPSVVALVLGLRARKMGKKYDLVIPTNATIGLLLGALGVLTGGSVLALGIVENHRRDTEIETIERRLLGKTEGQAIAHEAACLLAKRSLLLGEFQDSNSVEQFTCDGKLSLDSEAAVLEDVRFKRSGTRHQVRVCFTRGARWMVTGFREGETRCDEPESSAAAAAPSTRAQPSTRSSP